jgi:8-oxo-dGTP diphosphatase
MDRTERAELTVLCLIEKGSAILLQNRVKKDWQGYTLPGGHIEPGESIVDAVVREIREETGLTVLDPHLCGVKQFPIDGGRYIVFLFKTDTFSGELTGSREGNVKWMTLAEMLAGKLAPNMTKYLAVFQNENIPQAYGVSGQGLNTVDNNSNLIEIIEGNV